MNLGTLSAKTRPVKNAPVVKTMERSPIFIILGYKLDDFSNRLGKNSTGEECCCRENHERVTNLSFSNAAEMHTWLVVYLGVESLLPR